MLNLPDVQLVTVRGGGHPPEYFLKALMYSMRGIEFGDVLFLTSSSCGIPYKMEKKIRVHTIPEFNIEGYNKFMMKELWKYVSLRHCLVIQSDGFVLHPECWADDFLLYDYIGAVWGENDMWPGRVVGNGGFSLRSRNLINQCSQFSDPINDNEDHIICRTHRGWFTERRIRFAEPEVANLFSWEDNDPGHPTFGFHSFRQKEYLAQVLVTQQI